MLEMDLRLMKSKEDLELEWWEICAFWVSSVCVWYVFWAFFPRISSDGLLVELRNDYERHAVLMNHDTLMKFWSKSLLLNLLSILQAFMGQYERKSAF